MGDGRDLRVLTVLTAYPPSIGGVQLHAQQLCDRLAADGVPVHVATAWRRERRDWLRGTTVRIPRPAPVEHQPSGVAVHQLSLSPGRRALSAGPALAYYPTVTRERRAGPALHRAGVRAIVDAAAPTVAHLHRIGREVLYEAFVRELDRRGVPWVLTPHHHPHWVRRRDAWWWDLYRRAHRVLVLSDVEGEQLVAGGVDPARVVRTVNGPIEVPLAPVPERHDRRVLYLGQVRRYKGIEVVVAAVEQLREAGEDVELHVVGPWVERLPRLRRRLEASPHVVVHGAVDRATKQRLLEDATVMCLPSSQESLGMVHLETWAVGRPVVGADIPPVRELFERTGGGLAVPRTPEAVAAALRRLLGDPDLRRRLATAGHAAVRDEYNWDTSVARTRRVYEELVGGRT